MFLSFSGDRQRKRGEGVEKKREVERGGEGRKQVVLGDRSAVASCLSPGSHLSEQTPSRVELIWAFV